MTIFRSRGFDTLIGKLTTVVGDLSIAPNSTAVIDGTVKAGLIMGGVMTDNKVASKTTLHVNGVVEGKTFEGVGVADELFINVHNVIVNGKVICDTINVEGTLAIKSGATLTARKILYRELIIETGAVVHGQMSHLDHVSEGEQV